MPVDKKVVSESDRPPSQARRSTRASSSEKSPPTSRRQSTALSQIPEEPKKKPSTPSKSRAKDNAPTVGTPKRRGRSSMNPVPAAVASPSRVTRRSVAAPADDVPTVEPPKRRGRPSLNPTPAAVGSPSRITRRSVAALAGEEEPKSEGLCSPTKSKRKSTQPKGKVETDDEDETQKRKPSSITKIEESPESRPSSGEKSDQVDSDSRQSNLPPGDRTPETITPTRSGQNTPSRSGSGDDRTPETKIPTRSNRNTPSGPGNTSGEYRTPTKSLRGSRPSTPSRDPVSLNSPRNISELKTSAKPSPDRHANCNSQESSPIFASCDLRRNSFSSPIRHSPRSSPSRQARLSSGESKDSSPRSTKNRPAGTKPISTLVYTKSASPSKLKNDHSPRSSPRLKTVAKNKETEVPEKHNLEDEDNSMMMPNKRTKRDTNNENQHSSKNKLGDLHKPKQEDNSDGSTRLKPNEETADIPTVDGNVEVEEAGGTGNEKETRSDTSFSVLGIQKLSGKTSSSDVNDDVRVDNLKHPSVSDETPVVEQAPSAKDGGSGKPGEEPSTETSEENVKEVAHSTKEEVKRLTLVHENVSPNEVSSASRDELKEVVENQVGDGISLSNHEERQVVDLEEEDSGQSDLKCDQTIGPPSSGVVDQRGDPEEVTENNVGNDEPKELEPTDIIHDPYEIKAEECKNPDQGETVAIVAYHVSVDSSDVSKGETLTIKEPEVNSTVKYEESSSSDKCKPEVSANYPVSVDSSDVSKGETSTIKEPEVNSPVKYEESSSSDQCKPEVSANYPVSVDSSDVSKGETPTIKEPEVNSPVKYEESSSSDQCKPEVSAECPGSVDSSAAPRGETHSIKKSLAVSPVKSDAPLISAFEKSTIEHIPVDEGYSETSDSDYPSSAMGPSAKGILIPSIAEGLGINDVKQDVSVTCNLASSDTALADIMEDCEEVGEIRSVPLSKDAIEESKSCDVDKQCCKTMVTDTDGDNQLVSSNAMETSLINENIHQENQPSFTSPLRLAVSPEPPSYVEDESTLKDETGSSVIPFPLNDIVKHSQASVPVQDNEESEERIDTTTVCEEKEIEGPLIPPQEECGPKVNEIDTTPVGDSDEEKRYDATSENNEKTIDEMEEALVGPQEEECLPEIYESYTASVEDGEEMAVVNGPMVGSDFIDDEAEEGEDNDEDSDNDEIIYELTEESDTADSDVELLDESCFIADEAKEQKLSKKKSSGSDDKNTISAENTRGDVAQQKKISQVDPLDESCFIVDDDERLRELQTENTLKNSAPDSEVSPNLDKPVFQVSEMVDTDGTAAKKTRKFASGAASRFDVESSKGAKKGNPQKAGLKSSQVGKAANSYASTAASQFVVTKTATKGKRQEKTPKAVKCNDAPTGSPPKSDSSFTSSDQEQENTKRAPKSKKRSATEAEAEALKERKRYKKELNQQTVCSATNAHRFRVKLCNISPRTTVDELKIALQKFGIATGLQTLGFCPKNDKHSRTAIASYDSKKNLLRALSGYGNVTVHDRRLFLLMDDETVPISDDQPHAASPKKSPKKKFVGIISELPKDVTIGDIICAYEQEGIKCINKVKIFKVKSSKDNLNFAKLEFSRKTALLQAIIVTDNISIKGSRINLKVKEKSSN